MKGSDLIEMTINLGGELIKLEVKFDDQNKVRDTEREVNLYIDNLRKSWQDFSDRKLIAMAAYRFAYLYHQLTLVQEQANELALLKCREIDQKNSSD